jgi:hypothetical protein
VFLLPWGGTFAQDGCTARFLFAIVEFASGIEIGTGG